MSILTGTAAPALSVGAEGDLFFDTTNRNLYYKSAASTWTQIDMGLGAAETKAVAAYNGSFGSGSANLETSSTNAGAISITKLITNISSAGAETRTLAAPGAAGILKIINMSVDGGDVTMAATNIGAGTGSATFDDVGDCLILMSSSATKWQVLGGNAVIA